MMACSRVGWPAWAVPRRWRAFSDAQAREKRGFRRPRSPARPAGSDGLGTIARPAKAAIFMMLARLALPSSAGRIAHRPSPLPGGWLQHCCGLFCTIGASRLVQGTREDVLALVPHTSGRRPAGGRPPPDPPGALWPRQASCPSSSAPAAPRRRQLVRAMASLAGDTFFLDTFAQRQWQPEYTGGTRLSHDQAVRRE